MEQPVELMVLCRICLRKETIMKPIVNTELQEVYQNLTLLAFKSESCRPLSVCYTCLELLRDVHKLKKRCLQAEQYSRLMQKRNEIFMTPAGFIDCPSLLPYSILHQVNVDVNPISKVSATVQQKLNVPAHLCLQEEIKTEKEGLPEEESIDTSLGQWVDAKFEDDYDTGSVVINLDEVTIKGVLSEERKTEANCKDSNGLVNVGLNGKEDQKILQWAIKETRDTTQLYNCANDDTEESSVPNNHTFNSQTTCHTTIVKIMKHESPFKIKHNIRTGVKRFQCFICLKQYSFTLTHSNEPYIQLQYGENSFICNACQTGTNTQSDSQKHTFGHSNEKIFQCDTCQKSFPGRRHLQRHIRIHTGVKPFQCDTCKKSFLYRGNFKRHILTHSGEKPFQCDTCQKSFSNLTYLQQHIRIHGIKLFKCDTCQKAFSTRSLLRLHIFGHTGLKPFKCDTCQKHYSRRSSLQYHIDSTHSGEKPFNVFMSDLFFMQT